MAGNVFRISVVVDPSEVRTGSREAERELNRVNDAADRVRSGLLRAFKIFGVVQAIRTIGELADAFTNLQNRLRVVVDGQEQVAAVTEKLLNVANRSRSSFEGTAELYSRVALATKDLGESQTTLLGITESVNKAIILSGASAKEANNGLIQLSQGIASNRLGGDELRSVLEQLPVVADVIAKSLGKTRGELRAFGVTGGITAKVIVDAFKGAREEIEGKFGKTIPTLGQGFVVLRNNLVALVGAFDKATGTSRTLSTALFLLSTNLENILKLLLLTSSVYASIKIAPYVNKVLSLVAAQRAATAAIEAGTASRINQGQAELQQAKFEQQGVAAKVASAKATLETTRAEQARAAVTFESTAAARTQAAAEITAAQAIVARATATLQAARAEQTRLLASESSLDVLAAGQVQEGIISAQRAELAAQTDLLATASARLDVVTAAGNEARAISIVQQTQLAELEGTLTIETNALAVANERLAITQTTAATQATFLGRTLASIKGAFTSIGAAIAANPITAALVGITAVIAALTIYRNDIKLSADSTATLGDVMSSAVDKAKGKIEELQSFLREKFGGIGDIIASALGKLFEDFDLNVEGFLLGLGLIADSGLAVFTGLANAIITYFQRLPAALGDVGTRAVNALIGTFEFGLDVITTIFKTITAQVGVFIDGIVGAFNHAGQAIKAGLEGNLSGALDEATKASKELLAGTTDALFGSPDKFINELTKATQDDIIPRLNNAFIGGTEELAGNVKDAFLAGFKDTTVRTFVENLLNDAEEKAQARTIKPGEPKPGADKTPAPKDAFADTLKELRQQEELLSLVNLTNNSRQIEAELLKTRNSLIKEGVVLTPDQEDQIRVQLTVNQSLSDQVDLLNELRGPQEELQRRTDAANAAFSRGAITGAEYAAALAKIKEDSLSLADKGIRDLQNQNSLLSIVRSTNKEREHAVALEQTLQQLKAEGATPNELQTQKLSNLIYENQALERQNELVANATTVQQSLAQKQEDANAAFARGALTADQYNKILRDIQLESAEASKAIDGGIVRGFAKIEDGLSDMASLAENTLVGAFQSAEDAIVQFVKTGELSFVSLIDTVIEQLIRLAVQKALLSFLDFAFPGLGTATSTLGAGVGEGLIPRADGGGTNANQPYLVGEEGPEIFTPSTSGTVIPHDESSAMMSKSDVVVVPTPAPDVNVTVVNVLDPKEVINAMNTPEGEKVIMNTIRKNKSATRNGD